VRCSRSRAARASTSRRTASTGALARAREAAGGRDVALAGGAEAARQYLAAGLVDELELHQVPILLGRGERLFDGTLAEAHGLRHERTIAGEGVVHVLLTR